MAVAAGGGRTREITSRFGNVGWPGFFAWAHPRDEARLRRISIVAFQRLLAGWQRPAWCAGEDVLCGAPRIGLVWRGGLRGWERGKRIGRIQETKHGFVLRGATFSFVERSHALSHLRDGAGLARREPEKMYEIIIDYLLDSANDYDLMFFHNLVECDDRFAVGRATRATVESLI
jgi:hypothetical protein